MKYWKKKVFTITRHFFDYKKKYMLGSWLMEVDKAVGADSDTLDILDGYTFIAPVENGGILKLTIDNKSILVSQISPDMQTSMLVNSIQFKRNDLIGLKNYANSLKANKMGLGFPYPNAFKNMFKGLRPNEIVTFDNGLSFLCTENEENIITLRKLCGNISNSPLSGLLTMSSKFDLGYSSREIQNLYCKTRTAFSDSVSGRIASSAEAVNDIKKFEESVEKNSEKRIDLGPLAFIFKKPLLSPPKWYTDDNQPVSSDLLLNVYSWMITAPVISDYKSTTLANECDNNLFNELLETYFAQGKFKEICAKLASYITYTQGDLSVSFKSYCRHDNDYIAVGYLFELFGCDSSDMSIIVKRLSFEDNDISKNIISSKRVQPEEFISFCKEKFNSDYFVIQNNKKKSLLAELYNDVSFDL